MSKNKTSFRSGRDSQAVQENIELLTGQRGNGLDRALTVRDIAALGLADVVKRQSGQVTIKPKPDTGTDNEDDKVVVEKPHAPQNVEAFGGFNSVLITWELPTFQGYSHAEIWRSPENLLGTAALISTTPATVVSDIVNMGTQWYYWVRFVNINNEHGPFHDVNGLMVRTSPDISGVVDELAEQLRESELVKALEGDITAVGNDLIQTAKVIAQNFKTMNASFEVLDEAQTTHLSASITEVATVAASETAAVAKTVETLKASIEVDGEEIAAQLETVNSAIAQINEDGSQSFQAMWGKKATAGDITAGVGLVADSDGTSQFVVSASQMFVYDPNTPDALTPTFAIDKGKVVIPKALIENATIEILNAQTIVADTIKAGIDITAPVIIGGSVSGAELKIGAGGSYSGHRFYVGSDGRLFAEDAEISGLVKSAVLEAPLIQGGVIESSYIQSSYIISDVPQLTLTWANQEQYGTMVLSEIEALGETPFMGYNLGVIEKVHSKNGQSIRSEIAAYNNTNKGNYFRYTRKKVTPTLNISNFSSGAHNKSCQVSVTHNLGGTEKTVESGELYSGNVKTVDNVRFTCNSTNYTSAPYPCGDSGTCITKTTSHKVKIEFLGEVFTGNQTATFMVNAKAKTAGWVNIDPGTATVSFDDEAYNTTTPTDGGVK